MIRRMNWKWLGLVAVSFCIRFMATAQKQSVFFIENKNQWNTAVKFKADLPGGAVFITDVGFTYSFYDTKDVENAHEKMESKGNKNAEDYIVHRHAYRINFSGANTTGISYTTGDKRKEYYNFFLGKDPAKWAGKAGAYNVVNQHNIYDGIDMKAYSNGNTMKYDFIVSPGRDPAQIVLNFEGVKPQLARDGSIHIKTSVNEVIEGKPLSYQWINGEKKLVTSEYRQLPDGNIIFEFPQGYDKQYALVIDPSLVFGTYSGGTPETQGFCAGYDLNGALFSGGQSTGTGWPATVGAFQQNLSGNNDVVINKYTPDGSSLIYSTYLGGNIGELPIDMSTNSNNELVLFGFTVSPDFPTTQGCFDNTNGGGGDLFVTRFSEDGSALLGSTYMGGTGSESPDMFQSQLLVDGNDNIVIVANTESSDFPVTPNAAQPVFGGIQDGIVFRVSADCSQLLYATYLGGSIRDVCIGVTLNNQGDIVVCGHTNSTNFPTTANVYHQGYLGGDNDVFVTIINNATGAISASTFIGTNMEERASYVQIDENQNIIVLGNTSGSYPNTPGTYNVPGGMFVDRLRPDLSTSLQSTQLGDFNATAFWYDASCKNTYIAGHYLGSVLPVTPDAFQGPAARGYYMCALDQGWQNLLYGTCYNPDSHGAHSRANFDKEGNLYHSDCLDNATLPTTTGVFAPTRLAAGYDNAAFKFALSVATNDPPDIILNDTFLCTNEPVSIGAIVNNTNNQTVYNWEPAAAILSSPNSPTVLIDPSVSTQFIFTVTNGQCGFGRDTINIGISPLSNASVTPSDATICLGDTVIFSVSEGGISYVWAPEEQMEANGNTAIVWPSRNATYNVTITDEHDCQANLSATVNIQPAPYVNAGPDKNVAYGEATRLEGEATGNFFWEFNVGNPGILNPEVSPKVTTTYFLNAGSGEGCEAVDSVTVYVIGSGLPNAFSPNGDGLNDYFKPFFSMHPGTIPTDFSIFNRWGERVYYSSYGESEGWNGIYNNKPADGGTYFYSIKYSIGDKEFMLKGDLTLIR